MADDTLAIQWEKIPLPDRLTHKVWKGRQHGYDELKVLFKTSPEDSSVYSKFAHDLKKYVLDPNMVAQESAVAAVVQFMDKAPTSIAAKIMDGLSKAVIDKCLPSTRKATHALGVEVLVLAVAITESSDSFLDILISGFGNKSPKIVTVNVHCANELMLAYGPTLVNPKLIATQIAKLYSNSSKDVRDATQSLTVTMYQYLGNAIKPFLADLKPIQLKELEDVFSSTPTTLKPTRLTRNQSLALLTDSAVPEDDHHSEDDQPALKMHDLSDPVNVITDLPPNFYTDLASSKWKERKAALDALLVVCSVPKIKENKYGELVNALAKRIADPNIGVATTSIQCIEKLAFGLAKDFASYRHIVLPPLLEKCKDKKRSVLDTIALAMDAAYAATSLEACIDDTLTALAHKNPSVKAEASKFLCRMLKTTREQPSKEVLKNMITNLVKILDDPINEVRDAAAETLGTLMKLIGERPLLIYFEKIEEIKVAKVREFEKTAIVKGIRKAAAAAAKPGAPAAQAAPPRRAASKGNLKGSTDSIDSQSSAPPRKSSAANLKKAGTTKARPQSMMTRPSSPQLKRPTGPNGRPVSAMASSSSLASFPDAMDVSDGPVSPAVNEIDALFGEPRAKVKRAGEDRGPGKWVLDGTRPDLVEFLKEQALACFTPALHNLLFSTGHYKEKDHMLGMTHLDTLLRNKNADCVHHSDVILKYVTIRFTDTNTSIILKCLDVVAHLVALLQDHQYTISDYEANAFLPSLVIKLGDTKEPVRLRVHQILDSMYEMYPPSKIFLVILKATDSKNSRQRAECIEELGSIIGANGVGVCPPKSVAAIAGFIGEREATVRNSALNSLITVARVVGEKQLYKLIGRIPEKDKSMLQAKLKRTTIVAPGHDPMDVDSPVRRTPGRGGTSNAQLTPSKTPLAQQQYARPQVQPRFAPAAPPASKRPSSSIPAFNTGQQEYEDSMYSNAAHLHRHSVHGSNNFMVQPPAQGQRNFGNPSFQGPPVPSKQNSMMGPPVHPDPYQPVYEDSGFAQQNMYAQRDGSYQQQSPYSQQPHAFDQQHFQPNQYQHQNQNQFGQGYGQQQQQAQFSQQQSYEQQHHHQTQFGQHQGYENQQQSASSNPNFFLTPEKVGLASYSSKYESIQQRETIIDLLVTRIMSSDGDQAIEALRQVEKIIPSEPTILLNHSNQLISSVTLQTRFAFTAADSQSVMKLCKHLLNTMLHFFDKPVLAASLSLDTLYQIMSELVRRLVDTGPSNRISGPTLVKGLNMLVVRILDNSPPDPVFTVLLRMLGEALRQLAIAPDPSAVLESGLGKYTELTMKCLWKSVRQIEEHLAASRLNIDSLVLELHLVFEQVQAVDAKKIVRPSPDLPVRTIKTMLSELTKYYGDSILSHFGLVDNAREAYVYTYTRNLLESQAKRARSVLNTNGSSSGLAGHPADSPDPFNMAKANQTFQKESTRRPSSELAQELNMIFAKIADKEHTKQAILELYHFQQQYPFMQHKVDECMSRTGQFFQTYIKRHLAQLEDGGEYKSSAGSSTVSSAANTARNSVTYPATSSAGAHSVTTVSQLRARLAEMRTQIEAGGSSNRETGS